MVQQGQKITPGYLNLTLVITEARFDVEVKALLFHVWPSKPSPRSSPELMAQQSRSWVTTIFSNDPS